LLIPFPVWRNLESIPINYLCYPESHFIVIGAAPDQWT